MSEEQELTSADFDATIQKGVTLVDFWAEWCAPCRMMAPVLEELAAEYAGKATVAKVNVDQESDLAIKYDIMSIPSLLIFKDGQLQKRFIGVTPKKELAAALDACT